MKQADILRLLRDIGLKPQTAAGQHFLMDEAVVETMIDVAGIDERNTVLEIGPGLGILTAALLETGAKVIAVELDQRLYGYLKRRLKGESNLTLIHNDIFKVRLDEMLADGNYQLVANLPYSATNLVFRNFLTLKPRPSSMTVMIQKEVAERISAEPGKMSMAAVLAQYYGSVSIVTAVPPTAFVPPPAVTSAVIHLEITRNVEEKVDRRVFRTAKSGFSTRRKKLRNALAAGFDKKPQEIEEILESIGLNASSRPQELSVEQWEALSGKLV